MAFCSNCGTRLIEGAAFCPECGTKTWTGGASAQPSAPSPIQAQSPPAYEPPQQAPPRQPERVPVRFGPIHFEVVEKQTLKFLKAEFENSAVRYESGGMYYMKGNLEIESNLPSAGGFLKSMVTRENMVKPVIKGTGMVWFEPSFGDFTIMDLMNEEWILDRGAYFASEMGVDLGAYTNKTFSGLFSGEVFFQTRVSGVGKVVIISNGPLETIELNNEKLVVDGSFAVARQASVQLTVARASKGIFGSMLSGEGIVNTFTGTGKVLIAPASNRHITMVNYLSNIHKRVMQIKNS